MRNRPHAGELIRESMDDAGWNVTEAAARLGCERGTLSRLPNDKAGVSANTALALEGVDRGTADHWNRLHARYELAWARSRAGASDRVRRVIPRTESLYFDLRNLGGVGKITATDSDCFWRQCMPRQSYPYRGRPISAEVMRKLILDLFTGEDGVRRSDIIKACEQEHRQRGGGETKGAALIPAFKAACNDLRTVGAVEDGGHGYWHIIGWHYEKGYPG